MANITRALKSRVNDIFEDRLLNLAIIEMRKSYQPGITVCILCQNVINDANQLAPGDIRKTTRSPLTFVVDPVHYTCCFDPRYTTIHD